MIKIHETSIDLSPDDLRWCWLKYSNDGFRFYKNKLIFVVWRERGEKKKREEERRKRERRRASLKWLVRDDMEVLFFIRDYKSNQSQPPAAAVSTILMMCVLWNCP